MKKEAKQVGEDQQPEKAQEQKPQAKERSKRTGLFLYPSQLNRLRHIAVDEGVSISFIVRGLVDDFLDQYQRK